MAAGDVWDYIFGSYVNAARALPYINDGVIVIRRLNARAVCRGTKPRHGLSRLARGRERADRCTALSVLRTVTHCEIRPTVTASRTRSIKSDDAERPRDWDACIAPSLKPNERAVQLGETGDAITGCNPFTTGGGVSFVASDLRKWSRLRLQIKWGKCKDPKTRILSPFLFFFSLRFLNIKIFKFRNAGIQNIVVRKVWVI